jgi:hypothetical protein
MIGSMRNLSFFDCAPVRVQVLIIVLFGCLSILSLTLVTSCLYLISSLYKHLYLSNNDLYSRKYCVRRHDARESQ